MKFFTSNKVFSEVAILAGGKGTRLQSRSGTLPKPMVLINDKPVLQHQIELCQKYGFTDILLLVHHQHHVISDYFGDGSSYGVNLRYKHELIPRGTAGALSDALHMLAPRFLLLYGDTYFDINLRSLWDSHINSGSSGTLFLHPNDHPHDSDLVVIDRNGSIQSILPYPHPEDSEFRNLVNAGLYVLERDELENIVPSKGKYDIAKNVFPLMLDSRKHLNSYISPEYIKDMGTPERLDKVEIDIISGLPEKLSTRNLRSAVFLDRDGTLIREVNHLKRSDQLELLPGVAKAVRLLNSGGKLAVVVTNQPVVARGDITLEDLFKVHDCLESRLGAEGAYIDRLYFCPHHPDRGFVGEVLELKGKCTCRKPETELINIACRELNIDRRKSWFVGDTSIDIETARRAGIRSILVRTGFGGSDQKCIIKPDYICPDLVDAVAWINEGHAAMVRKVAQIALAATDEKRLILIGGLARAGKSFAAQVLKELLSEFGREAHVISLDGWIKPVDQRKEGFGIHQRYDLETIINTFAPVINSKIRENLKEPLYDRILRTSGPNAIEHSIGPKDLLIIEGVPALLIKELNDLPNSINVYVDTLTSVRSERLTKDYKWRGQSAKQYSDTLAKREFDEVPIINQSREIADFVICQNIKKTLNDSK